METLYADIRTELIARRTKLENFATADRDPQNVIHLLHEVDDALKRMDAGSYGLCEECHEPIERNRLAVNPLLRFCLDHLTRGQREALEQDLILASRVQRTLLPQQSLSFRGWDIAYLYLPLGPVSGDYCDVVTQEENSNDLFFLLGDVAGKGVAASMLMAHLHAIFRSLIAIGLPVGQLLTRANRIFCESIMPGSFATLICGRSGANGNIEICNAGHCPLLLVRGKEVTSIAASGLPLGMFCVETYPSRKLQLAPGDTLVLYTDGLSEARNTSQIEYGTDRLSILLTENSGAHPQALVERCVKDLAAFLEGAPRTDDLTIMAIKWTGVLS